MFKFSVVLFALRSDEPPGGGISGQLDIWSAFEVLCKVSLTFGQPLGQTELLSDIPHGRGI